MDMLDKIQECDSAMVNFFCETQEHENFTRFRDNKFTLMYAHNFTKIKNVNDETPQLIESEIANNKNEGKDYCLIRLPNDAPVPKTSQTPSVDVNGIYTAKASSLVNMKTNQAFSIAKVDSQEMLKDVLRLSLEESEEDYGADFCNGRTKRYGEAYLSDKGVDCYLCYVDEAAIGRCELFAYGDLAYIEDFYISPSHQRKGYGTTMFMELVKNAMEKGVTTIYLLADEEDTPKEMYKKMGFEKISQYTELLFKI